MAEHSATDTSQAATEPSDLRVPGYTIFERLGAGGFGEVFRARRSTIDREVAIKVLHAKYSADDEAIARFIAEARAVNKIAHPGIVDVFDFGVLEGGRHYFVMEILRGTTLRDVLRERTRLPLDEALPILRGIAEAVDAAHRAGVAHRDLKPDNVFILDGGAIKLIDFGLAKLTDDTNAPVTVTGAVFGTPLYMSPEQCRGKADLRTDLYSFGALAFHVLTGSPPFSGPPLELALHHLNDPAPIASTVFAELPARVDRVLAALLEKDPAARPSPLALAVDALEGRRKLSRRPRLALVGAVLVAGALVTAAVVITRNRNDAVAGDDCEAGEMRVQSAWGALQRNVILTRFAVSSRDDVQATKRILIADLDKYAADWSKAWNAACVAPDRKTNPLLQAQRINCLERALSDLRGFGGNFYDVEPVGYARGFNGATFSWSHALQDCSNEAALRAMPPAPPPERAAEVGEQIALIQKARIIARAHFNSREGPLEPALELLDQIISRLDAIGTGHAADAAITHAWYSMTAAQENPALADAAKRSIERAATLSRKYRADFMLSRAYQYSMQVELATTRSSTKLRELAEKAAEAAERAGHRAWPRDAKGVVTLEIAMLEGDVETALRIAQEDLQVSEDPNKAGHFHDVALRLAYFGRHDEALALARAGIEGLVARWGTRDNRMVADALEQYATLLMLAGRWDEARAPLVEALEWNERNGMPPVSRAGMAERLVILEDTRGDGPATDAAVQRFVSIMPAPRPQALVRLTEIVENAGRYELASRLLEQSGVAEARYYAAGSALQRGDLAPLRALLAERHAPPPSVAPLVDWMRMRLDLIDGRPTLDRFLASRRRAYAGAPFLEYMDMPLLLAARRWREVIASGEPMLSDPRFNRSNLAPSIDAIMGRALLELGENARAKALLERSLFAGITSFTLALELPDTAFALARALVATNGDKARARQLAEFALSKYGELQTAERAAVQSWLATQP